MQQELSCKSYLELSQASELLQEVIFIILMPDFHTFCSEKFLQSPKDIFWVMKQIPTGAVVAGKWHKEKYSV